MEDKQLQLGFISTRELAEWFGISYDWFRRIAKKKYKELEEYCDYEKQYGGILVKAIRCEIYIKEPKLYDRVEVYTHANWRLDEPDTAVRVASSFLRDNTDVTKKLETITSYARKARTKFFGSPKDLNHGEEGGCHYVFAKMYKGKIPADNRYQIMSNEEYQKFLLIEAKYFTVSPEKLAIALEKLHEKQWTAEIALEFFLAPQADNKSENYRNFVSELSRVLGCDWMVSATYARKGYYYIEEKDEEGNSYLREVQMELPGAF